MIAYILKTIICSAFFLGVYYLLLERAKMPGFNRAYLMLALIASFGIPLITFTTEVTIFPMLQEEVIEPMTWEMPLILQQQQSSSFDIMPFIIPVIYSLITVLLLTKFIRNIARLIILIRRSHHLNLHGARVVLLKERVIPFSFFSYVFLSEQEYASGQIEPEVMHHETEHGRQLHTIDIIFIELLKTIVWFNPLLILYRKAIQLNHEFLADEAVVAKFNDPVSYQLLLVNRISRPARVFPVTSPFSYKITKKRLVMITNPFNRKANLARALAVIPATALAVMLFSERVVAQVIAPPRVNGKSKDSTHQPVKMFAYSDTAKKTGKAPTVIFPMYGGTKEGVTAEEIAEYQQLAESKVYYDGKGNGNHKTFDPQEMKRMKDIFSRMSQEQQYQQDVVFFQPMKPYGKATPGETMFQGFLDGSKYGVWIDNKKVSNASLADYKNTDFSYVTISKLYGKAKEGRSYTHQVNLMSNAFFKTVNAEISANREPVMVYSARKRGAQ